MARGRKPNPNKVVASFEETLEDETQSGVTIKDALLYPFFIRVDSNSFTVFKTGSPIMVGCFTELKNALKRIAQTTVAEQPKIFSIGEYIKEFETVLTSFEKAIKE